MIQTYGVINTNRGYTPKHSIMEFKGLGKEVWQGVDVEKYIDEERNSWDR